MDATADVTLPVQKQLDAYNARDIEAFMPWWAEDCRYHEFPGRLLAEGAAAVRVRHVERFREPDLHGFLLGRTVVGNLVVDREVVRRTFPDGPGEVDVLAIYEVEGGRIARAWFKSGAPRMAADPFTLRTATAVDAAAARALTRAAYARWVPAIGREPLPMVANYEEAVRLHRIDLLERDGELTGLVELVPGDGHLLIRNVAVVPAWQGRGLGRRLLAHAEQVAAASGLPRVALYTNALFAANVRLYRALGYGTDREERSELGTTVYMSKPVRAVG